MITLVVDKFGHVLHDCQAEACEVSYDGYIIETGIPAEGAEHELPAGVIDQGEGAAVDTREGGTE